MPASDFFHYPSVEGPFFGRVISTTHTGNTLWSAVQMERSKRTTVVVTRRIGGDRADLVLDADGLCHQPFLAPVGTDRVLAVWNEVEGNTWSIKCATLREQADEFEDIEIIHRQDRLCLPPTAAVRDGEIRVAWAGRDGDRIRIYLAKKENNTWTLDGAVSPEDMDAFRPFLAASGDGVYLAWDQYRQGNCEVVIGRVDGADRQEFAIEKHDDERFLCPKIVIAPDGTTYATWLALRDVTDSLGIIDHLPFAPVVRLADGTAQYLVDQTNPANERMAADLRNGLLASEDEVYCGYAGLRRNPMLSMSEDGDLWCLWEARFEHDPSSTAGHLLGRKLQTDDTWTAPAILHSGGYAYSAAAHCVDGRLPVSFLRSDEKGMDILRADWIDLTHGEVHDTDHTKWTRWKPIRIEPVEETRKSVKGEEQKLQLFWADTHCHSMVSSDAEGEVDELIHFARDAAGLDAVCIIDNDFYPHKALTHAEWQMHQEFCAHFTKEDEFVVFPGWEYTYHRKDLTPDFNHRCIIYPRPGWPIFRRIDPEARVDRDLFRQLKGTPAMCYPHHSTYEIVDPELDWAVEVVSSWRVCIEENDFTMRQLQNGAKLGFIGSSDSHRAVPGLGGALTGIFAAELTPEALFDAYRNRRTIATQGHRVLIDFRAGDTFIGGEATVSDSPEMTARVDAPEPIEFVELVRDGEVVHRIESDGTTCDMEFTDNDAGPGKHFYFVRVKLVGDPSFNEDPEKNFLGPFNRDVRYGHNLARAKGPFAWTSPIWVRI